MEGDAIRILDSRRIMAISTVRPDGWPQTTIVGYANIGFLIYFLIFRSSQKFANISHDDRISVAIGEEPRDLRQVEALYAGCHASEVTDARERETAWRLLTQRHPNLAHLGLPDKAGTAMMRARCEHVSVLDYSKGLGHTQALTVGARDEVSAHPPSSDEWGSSAEESAG